MDVGPGPIVESPAVETSPEAARQPAWHVLWTRSNCEALVSDQLTAKGFHVFLPTLEMWVRRGAARQRHRVPMFPGYVFLQLLQVQRQKVYQSDYVANLLDVPDQETFAQQLGDILQALETDLEVFLAPQITAGARVKVKSGPLRGMEGWVQERAGVTMVLLRLDFISQAAAVKIEATELEIV